MDDRDLDRLLSELPVPEPSEEAKKRALKAARDEFEKIKVQGAGARSQGIAGLVRLMGEAAKKLLSLGGSVMTRPAFVNSAIGLFIVFVLGVLVTPMFMGQRSRMVQEQITPAPPVGARLVPLEVHSHRAALVSRDLCA